MGKLSFDEFVEQEREKAESRKNSVNWEERKKFYLDQVDILFHDVQKFLREYQDIQITKEEVTIEEDYFGEYEVPVLHIQLYAKQATLIPAGTFLIGTPGRVDLVGDMEKKRIILTEKNESILQGTSISCSWLDEGQKLEEIKKQEPEGRQLVWKVIIDLPRMQLIDLNKDNFLNSLQEVLDA